MHHHKWVSSVSTIVWYFTLMNNAGIDYGVFLTLMHQIENYCEISGWDALNLGFFEEENGPW